MEIEAPDAFLSAIVDGVVSGKPPTPEMVGGIISFLTNMQSKLDLGQAGMVHYHLRRIQKIANMMEKIEDRLFAGKELVFDMTTADGRSEALEWFKQMQKNMLMSMEYVDGKASKPAISSPESMKNAATTEAPAAAIQSARFIPPEKRQQIRNIVALVTKVQREREIEHRASLEDDDV